MSFDLDKKQTANREDLSRKGSIDRYIRPLCDIINSKEHHYTTSSCAGRIVLNRLPDSGRKQDFEWLFVSHDPVTLDQLKERLTSLPEQEIWLRFEPFILHIASRTIEHANDLLKILHNAGVKRAGIISIAEERIVIEAIGNERIDSIVARDGRLVVTDDYLGILVEKSNSKFKKNLDTLNRLEQELESI